MSRCPASIARFKATELSTPPDNNTAIFTCSLSRSQAASLLGVSLRTLFYKMRRLPVR